MPVASDADRRPAPAPRPAPSGSAEPRGGRPAPPPSGPRRPGVARALAIAIAIGTGLAFRAPLGPLGCGPPSAPPVERIVLVTIDTLRADHVGAYGDERAVTPHLDALAAGGVRFATAVSPTPITLPSHASILTGLDPPHHGVRDNSVFVLPSDVPTLAEALRGQGFATAAFVAALVLDSRFGLDRGFDVYDDAVGARPASRAGFAFAERPADAVVDAALAWLETAPERFFLWVHLYDPHADYQPPSAWRMATGGDAYRGEIAFADAEVGRLLSAIEERFGRGGLSVLVTSDHGESLGEHGEATHALTIYDATQLVPLLWRAPGLPAGRVVPDQVRLVDIAPSLLALAGAPAWPDADGRDLAPLVAGAEEPERVAYVETLATQIQMGWSPLLGLRTAGTKYVRAPRPELYDLSADPRETRNLASERPERVAALDEGLTGRLADARPIRPDGADLDAEDRARLESLGYVVPEAVAMRDVVDLGVVGGPDPKDRIGDLELFHLASSQVAGGRGAEALALLDRIELPGARIHWLRAQAAVAAGRGDVALASARRVIEIEGRRAENLSLLGYCLLAAGRPEAAREQFEAARALGPEQVDPLLGLGEVAERSGDLAGAMAFFAQADALSSVPGVARLHRARIALALGRVDEAERWIGEVPAEIAGESDWPQRLARAERDAGLAERGLARLHDAVRERPDDLPLQRDYAAALDAAGRSEEALAVWRRVYQVAPGDPSAANDLAWGLAAEGAELDRALDLARQAVEGLAAHPATLDTLATVHWARGEWSEAIAAADRGLAAAGPGPRAHLWWVRAAAAAELGRPDEAREALSAARAEPEGLTPPWAARADALAERLGTSSGEPPAPDRRARAEGEPIPSGR